MTELDDDLDAALTAKVEDPDYATVDVTVNGKLRTLRFEQMSGLDWAEFAAQCPPNMRSGTDRSFGYNMRAMVLLAGPASGKMRDGDDWIELTAEQWTKLLRALTGIDHRSIANQLFELNEWQPAQAVDAARKAFAVELAKNSNSPAPSESPTTD